VVGFGPNPGFCKLFPGGFSDVNRRSIISPQSFVTESETQPNFIRPNPLQLLGIALRNDAQTSAQEALFQAVQPGESYGGCHAQTRRWPVLQDYIRCGTRLRRSNRRHHNVSGVSPEN
jgi:hypothetical protein